MLKIKIQNKHPLNSIYKVQKMISVFKKMRVKSLYFAYIQDIPAIKI